MNREKDKHQIEWRPHKGPQERFHSCPAFEVLYGGGAGGGKSDSLLLEATKYIGEKDYTALLLRRKFTELSKADGLIDRSHKWYPSLGGKWNGEKKRWTFPSGAIIEFGHCEYEHNKYDYQSSAYSYIGFDEVTHFTESMYLFLMSRCRNINPRVPKRIRSGTNPGNIGHVWCKKRFIEGKKPYVIYKDKNGNTRCFIPATVYDNPTLMKNDPEYVKRLELLPEKEKRMFLYGDWDVFEGMYFDEWNEEIHVVKSFDLGDAYRFLSIDYGYSAPSSVGWYAVMENGHIYRYRELYKEKLTYTELGNLIIEMTPSKENIAYAVADPSMWGDKAHHKDSIKGESGGEILGAILSKRNITLMKGDNDRLIGWGRCREFLKPYKSADGLITSRFKVFDICKEFIRTIPQLIHDDKNVEDLNTSGEDHCADEWRMALMSRPSVPEIKEETHILTRDELLWKRARETLKRHKQGLSMPYIGRE